MGTFLRGAGCLAVLLLVAASSVLAQGSNPYRLGVDRAPFVLPGPQAAASASAAAGASSARGGDERPSRDRMGELAAERDAWRRRAEGLEAEKRAGRAVDERASRARIDQLTAERDAWRRRAEVLETELRLRSASQPPLLSAPAPR